MSLKAGSLIHTIEIQRVTNGQDEFGDTIETIDTILTTNASINPITSKELFNTAVDTRISETTHRITIRYEIPIKTTDKILFGSRTFNITSIINPKERNVVLEILATETID